MYYMKKSLLLLASFAVLLCACEKEPDGQGGSGVKEELELTGIEIDEMVSKTVKAGEPSTITIKGGEFDELVDHVWLGWEDADTLAHVSHSVFTATLHLRRRL